MERNLTSAPPAPPKQCLRSRGGSAATSLRSCSPSSWGGVSGEGVVIGGRAARLSRRCRLAELESALRCGWSVRGEGGCWGPRRGVCGQLQGADLAFSSTVFCCFRLGGDVEPTCAVFKKMRSLEACTSPDDEKAGSLHVSALSCVDVLHRGFSRIWGRIKASGLTTGSDDQWRHELSRLACPYGAFNVTARGAPYSRWPQWDSALLRCTGGILYHAGFHH